MNAYEMTIRSMSRGALETELSSLRRLSDEYRDEVRQKTNLILKILEN